MPDQTINYPADRKYSQTHEWVKQEGDIAIIGISDYAQNQLGDVVFVELPSVGSEVLAAKPFGVVESVKAASDLFSPVSGTVEAVNSELLESPQLVNQDALGAGWLLKVRLSKAGEMASLLDAATYQKKIESGELH